MRAGALLLHYWRDDASPYQWHGPDAIRIRGQIPVGAAIVHSGPFLAEWVISGVCHADQRQADWRIEHRGTITPFAGQPGTARPCLGMVTKAARIRR